jgi:hypothetical protein
LWQEINQGCLFRHCGGDEVRGMISAMSFYIALAALVALAVLAGLYGADSRPHDGRHNWAN